MLPVARTSLAVIRPPELNLRYIKMDILRWPAKDNGWQGMYQAVDMMYLR